MAIITAPLVLIPYEHEEPQLLTAVTDRTEAHLYGPTDCSAYVQSRWSVNRTTTVSPKHAEPFHTFVSLVTLNPLAGA
ncbi:hypothetical protein J1614_010805 [Plenodomus biglobosus]|nr:hypothetical protein J1614_010805 [Plenodomus biglobosus]